MQPWWFCSNFETGLSSCWQTDITGKKGSGSSVPARLGVKVNGKFNGFFIKTFTTSFNFWSAFCCFRFNSPILTKASTLLTAGMNIYSHLTCEMQVTLSGSNLCMQFVMLGCGQAAILQLSLAESPVLCLGQLQLQAFCWDMGMLEEQWIQATLPLLCESSSTVGLRGREMCLHNRQDDWPGIEGFLQGQMQKLLYI